MSNIFVRGGQISIHAVRMFKQVVLKLMQWGILLMLLSTLYFCILKFKFYHIKVLYWLCLAELANAFGNYNYLLEIEAISGFTYKLRAADVLINPGILVTKQYILSSFIECLILSTLFTISTLSAIFIIFFWKGNQVSKDEEVRGKKIIDKKTLVSLIEKQNKSICSKGYSIAEIPFPSNSESRHTLITGNTGAGKTVLISDLINQIKKRGDRAIIFDKMRVYTERFYNPNQDVLLNPFDGRSPGWSIFKEVRHAANFDAIASAFMPLEKVSSDPFWIKAARTIFAEVCSSLFKQGGVSNSKLVDTLLRKNLSEAAQLVKGTPAQAIIDEQSPKTALSVMSVLSTYLKCLKYLKDDEEPFSIREWVSNEQDKSCIFIPSSGDLHASLMPLISVWIEIAINNILSLSQSNKRKIWIILDELPSLHTLPSLEQGLSEVRQFGGCFVLSIQAISQLRDSYGYNGAQTISSLCNNRIFLQAGDPDSAKWYSDNIGTAEIEEFRESLSYGAHEMRDGVSVHKNKITRQLVLPSELSNLKPLEGYFCMAGGFPVAQAKFKYQDWPKLNAKSIEYDIKEHELDESRKNKEDTDIIKTEDINGSAFNEVMEENQEQPEIQKLSSFLNRLKVNE